MGTEKKIEIPGHTPWVPAIVNYMREEPVAIYVQDVTKYYNLDLVVGTEGDLTEEQYQELIKIFEYAEEENSDEA